MRILFAILLIASASYAATIQSWDTLITLNEDNTAQWTVKIAYTGVEQRSSYYILSSINDLQVTIDGQPAACDIETINIGSSIVCNGNVQNITYKFTANDMVSSIRDFNTFNYKFTIPISSEYYSVKVELPLGSGLVADEKLEGTGFRAFEPLWNEKNKSSERNSDGRKIYVLWEAKDPKLGEEFNIRVFYEIFDQNSQLTSFIIVLAISIIFIGAVFSLRRRNYKSVLPVLTEPERKIMEMMLKEEKPLDQRRVIKELDYSKPKVSRLIRNLKERGLLEIERKGRTNVLKLQKMQEKRQEENKDKK